MVAVGACCCSVLFTTPCCPSGLPSTLYVEFASVTTCPALTPGPHSITHTTSPFPNVWRGSYTVSGTVVVLDLQCAGAGSTASDHQLQVKCSDIGGNSIFDVGPGQWDSAVCSPVSLIKTGNLTQPFVDCCSESQSVDVTITQ